jgi:methylated-DNA-[protein]-cysteine S-methyltransferase
MNVNASFRRVRVETPAGPLVAVTREGVLQVCQFEERTGELEKALARLGQVEPVDTRDPGGVASALRRYLAGDLAALDGIEVDGPGTPFQRRVWAELRRIPAGSAISYGELARRVGNPRAVRAVGAANGANPVAVVVPCHRVVAASGDLWGYGGGLERKRWLLAHEGVPLTPDGRRVAGLA